MKQEKSVSLRYMAKVGVLSAIAFVLMLFEFPLPFLAPSFYELDLSDIAALIGSFALGPVAGVLIELIKNLLNVILTGSDTAFVGEFANFVTGCAFVLPAAFIYKYRKNFRAALLGMVASTCSLAVIGGLLNYFVMIPTFSQLYGVSIDAIVAMGHAIFPAVTNLPMLVVLCVVPFNLVKGILCSVATLLLYKRVSPLLHK